MNPEHESNKLATPDEPDHERLIGLGAGLLSGVFVGMCVAYTMAKLTPTVRHLGWVPVTLTVVLGGVIGFRSPRLAKNGFGLLCLWPF